MKKIISIIFITVLIMSSFNLRAENDLENYLLERGKLIIQYDSLKAQVKDSTWFDLKNFSTIQSAIINEDNFIINEFQSVQGKYDELVNKNEKLSKQLSENETALKDKTKWVEWGMYAGGALLLLFVIVLVLLIIKLLKNGKLKKQIQSLEKLHEQYQERLEASNKNIANDNSKVTEVEAAYNQIINENKVNFEKEKNSISERLSEAQQNLESLKSNVNALQNENSNLLTQIESIKGNNGLEKNEDIQKLQEIIIVKDNEIFQLKEKLILNQKENEYVKSENINEDTEFLKIKIIQLEKELESKETDIIEAHKFEKSNLSSEIDNIKHLLDEEKLYNEELKKTIEDLKNEKEALKNSSNENSNPIDGHLSNDTQVLIEENNTLKVEVEEYKKILDQELEFRKDILKLIQELKNK